MTSRTRPRAVATLILAVAGPVAFFSGLAVLLFIPRGVPRPIMALFAAALGVTAVALMVYLALDAGERMDE